MKLNDSLGPGCVATIVFSWLLYNIFQIIKAEVVNDSTSFKVEAFFSKAVSISLTMLIISIILGVIYLIIIKIAEAKVSKLTQELELRSLERKQIEDKMNSLLRKLGD